MKLSNKNIVKTIHHTYTMDQMWWYWTTEEGLNSFFGMDSHIVMELFGPYEIYFLMDQPYGLRGSETCQILSFIPNRMLSFTWNAPPAYPEIRNHAHKTWVVIEFDESQLRLTHTGWPHGEEWDEVYRYFDKAWTAVLNNLKTLGDKTWKKE